MIKIEVWIITITTDSPFDGFGKIDLGKVRWKCGKCRSSADISHSRRSTKRGRATIVELNSKSKQRLVVVYVRSKVNSGVPATDKHLQQLKTGKNNVCPKNRSVFRSF